MEQWAMVRTFLLREHDMNTDETNRCITIELEEENP